VCDVMCRSFHVVYAHHPDKSWKLRKMNEHDIELEQTEFGNDMPEFCNVITGYRHPPDYNRSCLQRVSAFTQILSLSHSLSLSLSLSLSHTHTHTHTHTRNLHLIIKLMCSTVEKKERSQNE
jgi:hypothetical protein